jgi:DNA polymerase I-like protein with 3'-5' exonuclease and polymerase domains
MITFYTSAKAESAEAIFGKSLKSFRPNIPTHRFVPRKEGVALPKPEPGEVVIVCGPWCFLDVQLAGLAPKNRSLNSMRERAIACNGGWYLLTFDPSVLQTEPEKREIIDWDVRLAHRLMTTGDLKPKVGDYVWVASYAQLIADIEAEFEKTGKPVKVSFDTETMGLYPWYPKKDFVCLQVTHRKGRSELIYLGQSRAHPIELEAGILDQIKWLLNSPKVRLRMANGKYDLIWIKEKWNIDCTNFTFDTLLVGSLLDENRSGSLNIHAKLFTDFGGYDDDFNAKFDKGKMDEVPVEDMLVYAGGDTDACYQVADIMQAELDEDPALKRFYVTILHPAARAFEKIERRGVLIDQEKFAILRQDLQKAIKDSQNAQMDLLPPKMRIKWMDRIDDQLAQGKNPLLPSIVNEYFFTPHGLNLKPQLYTPKDKKASLAKAHLRLVGEGHPVAGKLIAEMTIGDSASKTLSTFVDGFLKHLRPDGRFHPSYMLFHGGFGDGDEDDAGTTTGRLSAKEPAFQIIPKKTKWAKRIRECYIAPPGKVIVSIDYSQGELRVVACFAPEKTMIQAYKDNLDLHAVTGARLAGVDFKEFITWKDHSDKELADLFDKHRGNAKPANFGLLYGQMAPGFMAYAYANYNIKLTLAQAEEMRDAFFSLYPGLLDFHKRQINITGLHGEVRSPLGRIRHLPNIWSKIGAIRMKAERQGINAPIQSCLADMMEWAIALINDAFPNEEVQVVGNIHDALIAYIDEDKVEAILPQVMEIMSTLPLHKMDWHPQVQFTVDGEYGSNLANMKKFKPALKLAA